MAHEVFGTEWMAAWARELAASEAYRAAARAWEQPVLLVLTATGGRAERSAWLDLWHGECREARPGAAGDAARAGVILRAGAAQWRAVLEGRLEPVAALVRGALRLERGSLLQLARQAGAARALVAAAARVETSWDPLERAAAPSIAATIAPAADSGLRASFVSTAAAGLRHDHPALRLWRKAKRLGTWNPADIDFTRDRSDWASLAAAERDVLLRLTAMFLAGEESVTLDLLPLVLVIAREGRLEEEMYLTSFLWEEAKHVDFFHEGFLRQIAPDAGDLGRYHGPAWRRIFQQELPQAMGALLTDAGPRAQLRAAVTYNMVVEGVLAETGYAAYFAALERRDVLPGLRAGLVHVKRDESRHIAYGVHLVSRLVAAEPSLWHDVEARMAELFPLALEVIHEIFAAYDVMPFGLRVEDFTDLAIANFNRRLQRIERARADSPAA